MSEVLHNQKQCNRYPKRYGEVNNFVNGHFLTPNPVLNTPKQLTGKSSITRYYWMRLDHIHFVEDELNDRGILDAEKSGCWMGG